MITMTDCERSEKPEFIYENVEIKKEENQPPQNKVKNNKVCLSLLCVFLLTAGIILCVCYTNEKKHFLTHIHNLTEEKEKILNHNKYLTKERENLLNDKKNLTEERELVLNHINNVTREKEQLSNHIDYLTEEREQMLSHIIYLLRENEQIRNDKNQQHYVPNDQDRLSEHFKWIYYNFSFYYISPERKSWSDSRRCCQQRGADLAIIKGKKEREFLQKFVQDISLWVGMREEERVWKWINHPAVENGFGANSSDCVVLDKKGLFIYPCDSARGWICEKTYSQTLLNNSLCN